MWTASAEIAPSALVPRPAPAPANPGARPVTPNDTARLVAAAEKIAEAPQAVALMQRVIAGTAKGLAAAPAMGWFAGRNTSIAASLGVASTSVKVGVAMEQADGPATRVYNGFNRWSPSDFWRAMLASLAEAG